MNEKTIWFKGHQTLEQLQARAKKSMVGHVGIEYTELGNDFLSGKMPVDERTMQPFGILHGGASVVLAETLGSAAASLTVNFSKKRCVGLEINANHIRPATNGFVYGTAQPLHIGRTTQIWQIKIKNEAGKLTCISRITVAVIDNPV